ncbi:hypothetical protein RZS08_42265, partial [Arthrospira platensis SPKY1]|nr:hypothetical protein [Arthrospira platensis SPKY1]
MKISFDFDDTLQHPLMQSLAEEYMRSGYDVYITTTRKSDDGYEQKFNDDLREIAHRLGIVAEKIRYTNLESKAPLLTDFALHYDDDPEQIDEINEETSCIG